MNPVHQSQAVSEGTHPALRLGSKESGCWSRSGSDYRVIGGAAGALLWAVSSSREVPGDQTQTHPEMKA